MASPKRSQLVSEIPVKSFIWKRGAFKGDLTLHEGLSNHCTNCPDRVRNRFSSPANARESVPTKLKKYPAITELQSEAYRFPSKGLFHLYLDCDDIKLRNMFDGIVLLRKRFPELRRAKFFIENTSPFNFSLACFVWLTWKRYLEILWYAVEIGLEHCGHACYSTGKGYAVLRTGAKYGIVPKILFSIGDTVGCKKCMNEFVEDIKRWEHYEEDWK